MRSCYKNKQKMYYALQDGREVPVYERDEQGNVIYRTVNGVTFTSETGSYELGYSEPVEFFNGISGELNAYELQAFGADSSGSYAKMTYPKGALPLKVGALIWKESEIKHIVDDVIDSKSADYEVVAIRNEDLNEWSVLLRRILK